jgi:hypothetical protein
MVTIRSRWSARVTLIGTAAPASVAATTRIRARAISRVRIGSSCPTGVGWSSG